MEEEEDKNISPSASSRKRGGSAGSTYVDHSIGGDAEERGSFVHRLDLLTALSRQLQVLQLAERALQGRPVLRDQVIASAQILQLTREGFQRAVQLALV